MDYNIKLKSGKVLRGFIITPGEKTRAVIILVHGLGEHISRYTGWAESFNNEGIGFTGVDLPGHGRSDGKRGHINSFSQTDEMIDILLNSVSKTFPSAPVFLYGHSLGGGIVLDYILRKNPPFRGAIVTSPWLQLSFEPDKLKIRLAAIIKNILPGLAQPSGLIAAHISHDNNEVGKYINDPLVHDRISVGLFTSAMRAGEYALTHASDLKMPLLIVHGGDDQICSPEGSRKFASASPLAELKIWDGGYHELHNDFSRDDVFAYILKWINNLLI